MRYAITQPWFGFHHEIEISKDEFDTLKEARNRVLLLASLEDKFMLLLENYEELEQEMIRLSLHRMIYLDNSITTRSCTGVLARMALQTGGLSDLTSLRAAS